MRAQLNESMGLRSTRTTARQREVPEAGTSNVSVPESLRKTHLTCGRSGSTPTALPTVYSRVGRRFHAFRAWLERKLPVFFRFDLRVPESREWFAFGA
jgi:hypothetical protein